MATVLVTNSGRLVPKAIIVREINLSLTPIVLAIILAESTTALLPRIKHIIPIIVNKIDFNIPYFGLTSSSSSEVLFLIVVNR